MLACRAKRANIQQRSEKYGARSSMVVFPARYDPNSERRDNDVGAGYRVCPRRERLRFLGMVSVAGDGRVPGFGF